MGRPKLGKQKLQHISLNLPSAVIGWIDDNKGDATRSQFARARILEVYESATGKKAT